MRALVLASTVGLGVLFNAGVAAAQGYPAPYPYPYAPPPPAYYPSPYAPPAYAPPAYAPPPAAYPAPVPQQGPLVVPRGQVDQPAVDHAPDGTVTVHATPDGPVDVHAPTSEGTVHAYGCSRVQVDPPVPGQAQAAPPAAPPCGPYYMPYPVYMMPYYYPPPLRAYAPPPRPKYAPDPGRTMALVLSSVTFGVGTMLGGTMELIAAAKRDECHLVDPSGSCSNNKSNEKAAYWTMGAAVTIPAGIPRLVVGDVAMEMLFGGLRVGSFAAGTALMNHTDASVPIVLSFVVPATLSIVDLVTVPHREQLMARARAADAKKSFHLDGIAPTVTADASGALAPAVGAIGRF